MLLLRSLTLIYKVFIFRIEVLWWSVKSGVGWPLSWRGVQPSIPLLRTRDIAPYSSSFPLSISSPHADSDIDPGQSQIRNPEKCSVPSSHPPTNANLWRLSCKDDKLFCFPESGPL